MCTGVKRHAEAPVRGHEVKKGISMLMHFTKDTSVALSKSQEEFQRAKMVRLILTFSGIIT